MMVIVVVMVMVMVMMGDRLSGCLPATGASQVPA